MIVYRLCRAKYQNDISGTGAEKAGGRWNSKGVALLYTCANRALCTAEIAVHTPMGIVPADYTLLTIETGTNKTISLGLDLLPSHWKSFPFISKTKAFGDEFAKNKKGLIFKVPSAVVQGEFNYLINPNHPDFEKVKIVSTELFEFDQRLFK